MGGPGERAVAVTEASERTVALTEAAERTVVLTFDNLGEASDLERGTWPQDAPRGRHPSVTVALPRLLDELDRLALRATFFVEALNCEMYPDAVGEIAARGHDVGVHGWSHEPWSELDAQREPQLLDRCVAAFATLGLRAAGFRPPGGAGTDQTARLLRERGYRWWSTEGSADVAPRHGAAGATGRTRGTDGDGVGLPDVAFDWSLVDAYLLMDRFAELRAARGDPAPALSPGAAGDRLAWQLARDERTQVLILHPFLMLDDGWWSEVQRLLAGLAGDGTRVLTADAYAASLA